MRILRQIRLTVAPDAILNPGAVVTLPLDQARHGALVLRLEPGDQVELVSRRGLFPARVTTVARHGPFLELEVSGPALAPAKEGGPHLALALINPPRFEWAVEKAVELGAAVLTPLVTERTKASPSVSVSVAKKERWRRLAEEARKQCGRPEFMVIEAPQRLDDFVRSLEAEAGPRFFFSPETEAPLLLPAAGPGPAPVLLIGPEGGFSPAETRLLGDRGFEMRRLGNTVLRAETAAMAALILWRMTP